MNFKDDFNERSAFDWAIYRLYKGALTGGRRSTKAQAEHPEDSNCRGSGEEKNAS